MSRVRRGRRGSPSARIDVLFVGAMALMAMTFAAGFAYDRIRKEIARPVAMRAWTHAQGVLETRLHQDEPLELGAVWATHSGMICGLVNGRHSFSGLAGMTPFAVDGERAVFALDQTALDFASYWRACIDPSRTLIHWSVMQSRQ